MSEQTRKAIAEAIQAHAADEWNGDLIVDWIVSAATVDNTGDYAHGTIYSRDPAPRYVVRGLLHEALYRVDEEDDEP